MPVYYDLTRLAFRPNGAGAALPSIERALSQQGAGARLLGVFVAEIGTLNEVAILQAVDDVGKVMAARDARVASGDLYGVSDQLLGARVSTYVSFPFLPPMPTGKFGPVYEFREYDIKFGALPKLLAAWEAAVPGRVELSPMLTAAYALDGDQPRMLHIWPYKDLNERGRLRSESVAKGVWPPKGGPDVLATMRSSIYLPAPFSPLQ